MSATRLPSLSWQLDFILRLKERGCFLKERVFLLSPILGVKPVYAGCGQKREWSSCAVRNACLVPEDGVAGDICSVKVGYILHQEACQVEMKSRRPVNSREAHDQLWEQPTPLLVLFFLILPTWSTFCYASHNPEVAGHIKGEGCVQT